MLPQINLLCLFGTATDVADLIVARFGFPVVVKPEVNPPGVVDHQYNGVSD